MIARLAGIDQPPWTMTTPIGPRDVAQWAIGAVVVLMLLAALARWRRTADPTGVLLLAGGLVCSLNEALVDLLGHCFFPQDDGIAYRAFGYAVPWWVVTAYVAFFGGLTWLTVELLGTGPARARVWTAIAVVWVLNLILELPILAAGVYLYYGYQPLTVGGFPLNWLVINSLGSLTAAVLTVRLRSWLTGPRRLLLILVPWATYFVSWVAAMPLFITLNAQVTAPVRVLGGVVALGLGLAAMDGLVRLGTARSSGGPHARQAVTDQKPKSWVQ